jgi:delta14-sterol reductase
MNELRAPISTQMLIQAGCLYAALLAFLWVHQLRARGEAPRSGPLPPDRAHPAEKLCGLSAFLNLSAIVAILTLAFELSLAPLLELFWSLFALANLLVALLAWLLLAHRPDGNGPAPLTAFWRGSEAHPRLGGVPLKLLVQQLSLLQLGLLNAAFAYQQFGRYGLVSPQMGLYALFWWIYLFTHFRDEESALLSWEIQGEKLGFLALWRHLVAVPFLMSAAGWVLIDRVQVQPAWWIWPPGLLFAGALWVLRSANRQQLRFAADPSARIWGRPAESVGGRFLLSGWWRFGRNVNDSAEFLVLFCIARTTGAATRLQYLLPLVYLVYAVIRAQRRERQLRAGDGELWERYRRERRTRMIPFLY